MAATVLRSFSTPPLHSPPHSSLFHRRGMPPCYWQDLPLQRRSPPIYFKFQTVNIKSNASNNELAVRPQDRVVRMEWDRRYLSVLGVENNQLPELRLQVPENVFLDEENDLRKVMESFRVNKLSV